MKRASWFTFLVLLSISCLDGPDCFELNYNLIGISFRVMGTGKPDTLRFDNIRISGTDSVFIPSTVATALGLPLDFTHDQSSIIFSGYRGQDTLDISYKVNTQFVSDDCGSRFVLTDLNFLKATFDSVRIVSRTAGNQIRANLEVYRCPRTDTMAIAFRQLTVSSNGARSSQPVVFALESVTPDFTGQPLYVNQNAGIIYLPVNMVDSEMLLSFVLRDGTQKELNLDYQLQIDTVRYVACGPQTFAQSMRITAGPNDIPFDSVSFVRDTRGRPVTSVLDPFDPMINIYRCPQNNIAGIYFRKSSQSGGGTDTVYVDDVRIDGVSVPLTSNLMTFINVPLNPTAASTTVTFDFQSGETRSLTISHDRIDRRAFSACGTQSFFTNLELTATTFDTTDVAENIKDIRIPVADLQSIPTRNIEIIQR